MTDEQIEIKRACPKCGDAKYKSNGSTKMPGHDRHLRGEYVGRLVGIRRCICKGCGINYKVQIIDPADTTQEAKEVAAVTAAKAARKTKKKKSSGMF